MDSETKLLISCDEFLKGWKHFCECIDFGSSNLDAEAISFMNEAPSEIQKCLEEVANENKRHRFIFVSFQYGYTKLIDVSTKMPGEKLIDVGRKEVKSGFGNSYVTVTGRLTLKAIKGLEVNLKADLERDPSIKVLRVIVQNWKEIANVEEEKDSQKESSEKAQS